MKAELGAQSDDFYVSGRLNLKLDLSLERETILQFFERVRREHAGMKRFRRRHDGSLVLEESEFDGQPGPPRRWVRLDPAAVRFGCFNPDGPSAWRVFGRSLLEYVPYFLSVGDMAIDLLEVSYGFDLAYSGNHDQLVADTLFRNHPLASFMLADECTHVLDCQPYLGIALSQACDVQASLEIKSRTSSYEVRTGDYAEQTLSVYLTVRRYWGFDANIPLPQAFLALTETADELASQRIVPLVVNPLAMAIASQP